MQLTHSKALDASHGIVCGDQGPDGHFYGWPTVTRSADGRLHVVASGLRLGHICPCGRTIYCRSDDDGRTWTPPRIINDGTIDSRDAGILALGGRRVLATWFASDPRASTVTHMPKYEAHKQERWLARIADWTDASVGRLEGSWVMLSEDSGDTWGTPVRVDVMTCHGPTHIGNGQIVYLGKEFSPGPDRRLRNDVPVLTRLSSDYGATWQPGGEVPLIPGTQWENYHEPHLLGLPDGRLLGLIRFQSVVSRDPVAGIPHFSMVQTLSDDGGHTWSVPEPLGFYGSPPHLLRHSSGILICSYCNRHAGERGQRVMFSIDNGDTWNIDWIIRDDGPGDLGYPSTVELDDGSLLTVYYQQPGPEDRCGILYSRWQLPAAILDTVSAGTSRDLAR